MATLTLQPVGTRLSAWRQAQALPQAADIPGIAKRPQPGTPRVSASSSDPKPKLRSSRQPIKDRRAPPGQPGSIRWLGSLLGRPLVLEKCGQKLHLTLLDRRRSAEELQAASLARLREELRVRLLDQEHQHASSAMRHLVLVHDVLGRQGWPGVQGMESQVLARALVQAQMLAQRESSRRLAQFIDRLHVFRAAAEAREDRIARSRAAGVEPGNGGTVQVSEVSAEEYEATQRVWNATQPADL
jgi:hypothetical protein